MSPQNRVSASRWAGVLFLALAVFVSAPDTLPIISLVGRIVTSGAPLAALSQAIRWPGGRPGATHIGDLQRAGKTLDACVQDDRNTFGENLVIPADAWICGQVTAFGANVTVDGRVDGDVRAVNGSVVVSGVVNGSVTALGGNINLQGSARVSGDVQAIGGHVYRTPDTLVRGHLVPDQDWPTLASRQATRVFTYDMFPWWRLLFWALVGAAFALFMPERLGRVRTRIRSHPVVNLSFGVFAIIGGCLAALALAVTCIGLPVALVVLGALWVAWVAGTVALGYWLGDAILGVLARERVSILVATVLGVLLVAAMEEIPVVGVVIGVVVGCVGVGAVLRAYFAHRRERRATRGFGH